MGFIVQTEEMEELDNDGNGAFQAEYRLYRHGAYG